MNLLRRHLPLAAVFFSCTGGGVSAATMCATNGPELQAALDAAEVNGQADVIRLATGFYALPSGGFSYRPFPAEGHSIELSGGWSLFFGNPCGLQYDATNAFQTVITAGTAARLLNIVPPAGGDTDVTVRRITFLGGDVTGVDTGEGGGLRLYPFTGNTGVHLIDQCAFLDNAGGEGAALRVLTETTLHVRNSLFLDNHSTTGAAVELYAYKGTGLYFTNNTVLGNTTDGDGAGGLAIDAYAPSQALVANNNFRGNTDGNGVDSDIDLRQAGNKYVQNNNYVRLNGQADFSSGNISVEPAYEPGTLIYTPVEGSALIDAGTRPPLIDVVPRPFERAWTTGVLDVNGHPRNQGRIDIGAYEATPVELFGDGFEP